MGFSDYKVNVQQTSIPSGVMIRLTKKQAKRRSHILENVDADVYEVISFSKSSRMKANFKRGEVIGLESNSVSRGILVGLSKVEKEESKDQKKKGKTKPGQ